MGNQRHLTAPLRQLLVLSAAAAISLCNVSAVANATSLLLKHHVINDGEGRAMSSDLEVYVDGVTSAWETKQLLAAGEHKIVVATLDGYQHSQWQGDCEADGSVYITSGQDATCEIVSSDQGSNIVVAKLMNVASPEVGSVVTFSILVSNLGPDVATSVNVVDVVVKGLEYQQGSMQGAEFVAEENPYGNGLAWTIDELLVGQSVELTFDAKVLPL